MAGNVRRPGRSIVRRRWSALFPGALTILFLVFVPVPGFAQSGIAGVVKDATGAVLPGVTVEASSPALIEKVRTVVTDGEGQYKLVDVRPGIYTVTFSLTGFSTVKREGLELPASFTATVNAELKVGALEETVTVSGQSPLVDVQSSTQHRAITRSLIDDLPSGRQLANYAVLIPGITAAVQDVGGSSLSNAATNIMGIHGNNSEEMPLLLDGMRHANIRHTGGGSAGPYLRFTHITPFSSMNRSFSQYWYRCCRMCCAVTVRMSKLLHRSE